MSVPTDTTEFDQSVQNLDFVNDFSDVQCYNISIDFDIEKYCDEYSSCNNVLQTRLTKLNKNDHVVLLNDMVKVFIKEQAGKCGMILYTIICVQ